MAVRRQLSDRERGTVALLGIAFVGQGVVSWAVLGDALVSVAFVGVGAVAGVIAVSGELGRDRIDREMRVQKRPADVFVWLPVQSRTGRRQLQRANWALLGIILSVEAVLLSQFEAGDLSAVWWMAAVAGGCAIVHAVAAPPGVMLAAPRQAPKPISRTTRRVAMVVAIAMGGSFVVVAWFLSTARHPTGVSWAVAGHIVLVVLGDMLLVLGAVGLAWPHVPSPPPPASRADDVD